jgi:hypothetical protein
MESKNGAVMWLRVMSIGTILIGAICFTLAWIYNERVQLFPGVSAPAWAIGASVMYMGLRYWRRIPEMEKNIRSTGGFSWANFKRAK